MPSRKNATLNIAIVHWVVNDVGGINSWTENIIEGLRRLGHTVQLYYGTHQRKLGTHPTQKVPRSRRWHLLPALTLSYAPDMVKKSVDTLNDYDLIIFAHPSPHPTKGNTQADHARGWQSFYNDTHPFRISVFHDRHWDRTNEWIHEVVDKVDYAHAAQHHFIESVEAFATLGQIERDWGYFPLVLPKEMPGNTKRERKWIIATQWLALKNHRYLVPYLLDLKLPLDSYGSGQTYHNLLPQMKNVYREDHHQDEVMYYNPDSLHIHYGHTEYRKVIEAMSKVWFSLDLSIQGMTNMTHWEPMTAGAISVMEQRVLEDKYCEIPEDCCLTVSLDELIDDMNMIGKMPRETLQRRQQNAWKFIQRCDCKTVAQKLLTSAGVA